VRAQQAETRIGGQATDREAPVIEVRHVSVSFEKKVVLDDICLDVGKGEAFAIAGENGSGKSTLLKVIIGLLTPTAGGVTVFGRDLAALGDEEARRLYRRWGMLFQYGALFSSMTVVENVAAPLLEYSDASPGLIRDVALFKIGLTGLPMSAANQYPNELSGGMRKRAALARAIALDPELLFLDEPTSGLDPISAAAFDDLITELKQLLGFTLVMVSHDLDTLWRVAERVVVLGNAKVMASGTMEELSRSSDPEVREYFYGPHGRAGHTQ
jgi:phospholipid/cholesterol/gamma-HCH transport system ATP-binding protein